MTDSRTTDERFLTRDEQLWVAERLLSRARHNSKKLTAAIRNNNHPELIRQLKEDINECMRMAAKFQGAP